MSKLAIRSPHNGETVNKFDTSEKIISLGVSADNSPIQNVTDSVSMYFRGGNILMHNNDNISLKMDEMFTVCFWAKMPLKAITDTVYPNKFVLVMNDNTPVIDCLLPNSVIDGEWHHYVVQRDGSNDISFYIDSVLQDSVNSTESFNLADKSYLFIGNDNPNATGYDVIIDDFIVVDLVIFNSGFSNPTDYIDVSQFKKCLYIKVSTGEVFGYKED